MGTKQIRVSEDLHARLKAEREEGETLGETLERLLGNYGLVDFADDMAEVADEHPTVEELEQSIEESDERAREEIEEQLS
ncbi:MAG: antitoxin VapB family protein [Halolamina sp.]